VPKRLPAFLSELPAAPEYNPVSKAIIKTTDPEIAAALQGFQSMPPSTGVLANPIRYQRTIACEDASVDLSIRAFGMRGCLLEEDIATGSADAVRAIFVGLFGRFATLAERRSFSLLLSENFEAAVTRVLPTLAKFMAVFPTAAADASMQYMASIRKAKHEMQQVNSARPPSDLLRDLLSVHLENAAVGACSSYMRSLLRRQPNRSTSSLIRQTRFFVESTRKSDPFQGIYSLLLRRNMNDAEVRILQTLGAIQIHHGSAGSNMVARYLASLHTKTVSDIFTAAQMTLDCARHFGAITGLTELVAKLETVPASRRDELIRQRVIAGDLPAFGHPEIAAAGRTNHIELDPRPAIYLAPVFEAIDTGKLKVPQHRKHRAEIVQRMYQIAFVEGIEKPNRSGRLRIAPNTDFGAWIAQELLGIDEVDRTFLSYVFRGFGWMMDVREQLQQPIIRPVIPPDPSIIPATATEGTIPEIVASVHDRLCQSNIFSFHPRHESTSANIVAAKRNAAPTSTV
jgi:citrate synthase